ncbi:MAG: hypothetical protein H8D23_20090 [Candidatus Brocadiales bacterium]|nr:hypothetical protein [Candidatus Brocadiales bacterium]
MNSDTTWNDGLLWRDGCIDNSVLSDLFDGCEALGFDLIEEVGSKKQELLDRLMALSPQQQQQLPESLKELINK